MSLKARRRAFLNKTIKYYNSTNRGINAIGKCSYQAGCAIGRFLPEDACIKFDKVGWGWDNIMEKKEFAQLVPHKLKDLGVAFLEKIQRLHDGEHYWDENGLTSIGQQQALVIKIDFDLIGAK